MHITSFLRRMALFLALTAVIPAAADNLPGGTFTCGQGTFLLNGQPFTVKAAELHYPRIPRPYWEQRIRMCRALGMNTVCMYVFWNLHEQREGEFDFTGQNDIAEFCRVAQRNGMYVIVRPGPYVCAEWEMGGLPWWLLKKKDIRLRSLDPYFMRRVEAFMAKVGEQLAPLTVQRGGPIIMVQVENEYGSYGEDKAYVAAIRDIVRRSGFDGVELFQCDWSSNFTLNGLDDLLWTLNFGTGADVDGQFEPLRRLRPESPLMCSEYWSGWFDKWGARHETRPAADMVAGLDAMLQRGISFSLYMTHGGTSFGHWAGANSPGFAPDVTSYDYDAPISESGATTPKYYALRQMMQRHAADSLPPVPAPAAPLISVPRFSLDTYAPLALGTDSVLEGRSPLTFEQMDMGWGAAVYSTRLPALPQGGRLMLGCAHDFAVVYAGGRPAGTACRMTADTVVTLPPAATESRLDIVVEGMGRINFGRAIKDFKGLVGCPVLVSDSCGSQVMTKLTGWTMRTLPDGCSDAVRALARGAAGHAPEPRLEGRAGYYRGTFRLSKTGDTYLNMEQWGKGQAYVNGHALGRFWSIGPQQTLYVPGCWLNEGDNELIVLDVVGPRQTVVWGQTEPVLDGLRAGQSRRHDNPDARPDLSRLAPVAEGTLADVAGWQTISLPAPVSGRYIALEATGSSAATGVITLAELYARDASGSRLGREDWTALYADSEDTADGNNTADKAIDQQESTWWGTEAARPLPHVIVIDMGRECEVSAVDCLPCTTRAGAGAVSAYRLYVY